MKTLKIKKALVSLVVVAVMLVMTLSASAMTHFDYNANTTDPSFTVMASLQGQRPTGTTVFTQMYATNRFDATGVVTPTYTILNMSVTAVASGGIYDPHTNGGTVNIGDFINIPTQYYSQSDNITSLSGAYTAVVPGSTIGFYIPETYLNSFWAPGSY